MANILELIWDKINLLWKEDPYKWNDDSREDLCNLVWNDVDLFWSEYDYLWSECGYLVEQISKNYALGQELEEAYGLAVKKADRETKRKLIKLILWVNGTPYTQEKNIDLDSYKVTANDVSMLMTEYKKMKSNINIVVEDVEIK